MSLQNLLVTTGVVSFALGGILLVLAARYCVREDMRAVFDDLSGRRRQRGVEAALLSATLAHASVRDSLAERPLASSAYGNPRRSETQHCDGAGATLVAEDVEATMLQANQGFLMARRIVLRGTQDVVEGGHRDEG